MSRLGRAALGLVLLVLATAGLLAVCETYRGEAALAAAQTAEAHGEAPLAIAAARVALEARVPYTEHAAHASTLLERLAARAKEARDPATAALALRVARQGAEATGDDERAEALRLQERALAAPVMVPGSEAPGSEGARPEATEPVRRPSELRATGLGRGPVGLPVQLAMVLGIALLGAAFVGALQRPAVSRRLCFGLSVAGTVVLAAARFFA